MTKDSRYANVGDEEEENSSALDEASMQFRNILDGTNEDNRDSGESNDDLIDILKDQATTSTS